MKRVLTWRGIKVILKELKVSQAVATVDVIKRWEVEKSTRPRRWMPQ